MNRTLKLAIIFPVAAIVLWGTVVGLAAAGSSNVGCGEEPVLGFAGRGSAVARGRGPSAIADDRIVTLEGGSREAYVPPRVENALPRHVASAPGHGTVYVSDRTGPDTVITVRPEGISQIPASGEVTHPAWSASGALVWAVDFRALKVSSPGGGSPKTIAAPPGATAIFSPIFTAPSQLLAVVQEPVEGDRGEDDSLNNLWRYDLVSGTWVRLTAFSAASERWSVLRTPVLAPDGTIFFVRLQGMTFESRPPSFELWSLRAGAASKVRDLSREMYLVGVTDEGLLWNIYDGVDWRLFEETEVGLVDRGCGAVMVDPRAEPDPDIGPEEASIRQQAGSIQAGGEPAPLGDAQLAVLIGDFGSRQEAEEMARRLGLPGLEVVGHQESPLAIAPGLWGVAMRVPPQADPTSVLDGFRRRFPELEERSWIVSLARGPSVKRAIRVDL